MGLTISGAGYKALFNHMTLEYNRNDNEFTNIINGIIRLNEYSLIFESANVRLDYDNETLERAWYNCSIDLIVLEYEYESDLENEEIEITKVEFYSSVCSIDGTEKDCSIQSPMFDSDLDKSILTDEDYYPTLVYTYSGSDYIHLYSTSITDNLNNANILLLGYKDRTFTIHLSTNGYYKMFKVGEKNRVTGYSKDNKEIATLQYQSASDSGLGRDVMKMTYDFIGPCCLFDFLVFSDTRLVVIDDTTKTFELDIIGVSAPTSDLLMTSSYESSLNPLDGNDVNVILEKLSLSGDHFRYANNNSLWDRPFPKDKSMMDICRSSNNEGWFYVFAIETGVVGKPDFAYAYIVMYKKSDKFDFYRFTKRENEKIGEIDEIVEDIVLNINEDFFTYNSDSSVIIDQRNEFLYENDYSSDLIKGIVPVDGGFPTVVDETVNEKTFKGKYYIVNTLFYDPNYNPIPFNPYPTGSYISIYSNIKNDSDCPDDLIDSIKARAIEMGFTSVNSYDEKITLDGIQQALFLFKFKSGSSYTILSNRFVLGETIIENKDLDNEKSVKPFTCIFFNAFTEDQFGIANINPDYAFELENTVNSNKFIIYCPKNTIQEMISTRPYCEYHPSFNFDLGCENDSIEEAYFLYSVFKYSDS